MARHASETGQALLLLSCVEFDMRDVIAFSCDNSCDNLWNVFYLISI